MRRPTPRPTSPMTWRREWPSGHNEGLPQPGIGATTALKLKRRRDACTSTATRQHIFKVGTHSGEVR